MKRTIVVVDTTTQSQTVFESEATTFGELLTEMTARGISSDNKTFYEGKSRREFDPRDDADRVLPSDIPYKGKRTNDLSFCVSTRSKNIGSGMDRKECYVKIKELGLEGEVKERFGRNYTQVPTAGLLEVLESFNNTQEEEIEEDEDEVAEQCTCEGIESNVTKVAVQRLAKACSHLLSNDDKEFFTKFFGVAFKKGLSNEELESLFGNRL